MKTMTAKYPGTCFTCHKPINRGESINFHGRGRAEHASCSGDKSTVRNSTGPDYFDMAVEDSMAAACGL